MGFGSNAHFRATGFRANSNRSGTTPAHDWANLPTAYEALIDRFQGVVLENRPAAKILASQDSPETLHYVDPPYPMGTRSDPDKDYQFEMDDRDHMKLALHLKSLKGFVVLSGYNCPLYEEFYSDWLRIDKSTFADGAKPRTESLWINPRAAANLNQKLLPEATDP